MRYVMALGALALGVAPSLSQTTGVHINDHGAAVAAYVATAPLAVLADDVCPGIKADDARLQVLRATANAFDREEDVAMREMKKVEAGARLAIARDGAAAWCREVWALIGPNGSRVPGLLVRH